MRNKALSFGRNKNPVPLRRVLFYFVGVCVCMLDFWRNLIDAGLFAAEGRDTLRLMRLASGGSEASAEIRRALGQAAACQNFVMWGSAMPAKALVAKFPWHA